MTAVIVTVAAAISAPAPGAAAFARGNVPASGTAATSPGPLVSVPRLATRRPAGATALGPVPSAAPLAFELVLAPSHPEALRTLLHEQRDPASPMFGRYLAPGEFGREFAPSPDTVAVTSGWLHTAGFTDVVSAGLTIKVRSNVGAVTRGLGVALARYRIGGGREIIAATGSPVLPSRSAGAVEAIIGLDRTPAAAPHLDVTPGRLPPTGGPAPGATRHTSANGNATPNASAPSPCTAAKNATAGRFFTPDQVGSHYGVRSLFAQGQNGAGRQVAVLELAPHSGADTAAYLSCFGLQNHITRFAIDGGGTPDSNGSNGTLESNVDIEEAATQAPGAAIASYEGPNTLQGEFDVWQKIVDDDTAATVSTSWGICEPNSDVSFDDAIGTLFQQAAAQGQTVVAASGDAGSEDCFGTGGGSSALAVDSPADEPDVTGVGGTTLTVAAEPVWNDCLGEPSYTQCTADTGQSGGAAGGGNSALFARPSWQPVAAASGCTTCREVPDVSANAGTGEVFRSGGSWGAIGGTSIAAPKIAAFVADVDTACAAPVGDLAPRLVALAAASGYGRELNDVRTGNNDLTATNSGAYPANPGFDLASGVGSPIAPGWSCPQLTSVSSTRAVAGARVTFSGFGLATASIRFGSTPATVLTRSATAITVTVPPGLGTVTVRGIDALGSGVHTILFTYPDSPGADRMYRTVASDGGIFDFGGAAFHGSTGSIRLARPIVGMAADPATGGYWFVASDGGVFAFDAPFFGSGAARALGAPVVGIASTPDGSGYWLVTAAGTVLSFGAAQNFGSATGPHAPLVGMAPTTDGNGYWLAESDGAIATFGNAVNLGAMAGTRLTQPIVGIARDAATGGYWMVAADGGIFGFRAPFFGSTGAIRLVEPIVGMASVPSGLGYWLVARDGGVFSFGDARFSGSMGGTHLNQPMVGIAASR